MKSSRHGQEVGHIISVTKLDHATQSAVAAYDHEDGVVDGIITNLRNCDYDPSALYLTTRVNAVPA